MFVWPWESAGDEWQGDDDGAPGYTFPPGVHQNDIVYCPKCVNENRSRRERQEETLVPPAGIIRRRDHAIWCLRHEEVFYRNFARYIASTIRVKD